MQDLNKDPLIEQMREEAAKHEASSYAFAPKFAVQHPTMVNELTAATVPYFWECPKQLLLSRQIQHLTGKIRNKEALHINLAFSALLAALAYFNMRTRDYVIVQLSFSLIDRMFFEQPVEHERANK